MITIFLIITVTGAFFLALYIADQTRLKIRQRKLILMMREIAELRNLNILHFKVLHDKIIAIDEPKETLIFLDHAQMENNRIVHLHEVRECNILLKHTVVQLELMYNDPFRTPLSVPFYRKYIDPPYKRKSLTESALWWKKTLTAHLEQETMQEQL